MIRKDKEEQLKENIEYGQYVKFLLGHLKKKKQD